MVYSVTSCAKDEDLFSSKVVGVSYSSISPALMCNQIREQKMKVQRMNIKVV